MPVYTFGPFEVRTRTREVYRSGTKIRLRGQPFQILELLLRRPGEVVTREEIRRELWPADTFVDFEHGLNTSIRKLRQALFDSALKPLYIETLAGVGYRFVAPVMLAADADLPGAGASVNGAAKELTGEPDESDTEVDSVKTDGKRPRTVIGGLLIACALIIAAGALWIERGKWGSPPTKAASLAPLNSNSAGNDGPGQAGHQDQLSPETMFEGKLWVVDAARAAHVTFPPPEATPDLTFRTHGIAYIGTMPNNCYTLQSFLAGCGTKGYDLKFSGIGNPNLEGAPAEPTTAMSGSWGVIIELTGSVSLVNGQPISILHDDGVALKIDGSPISGFNPYVTPPTLESSTFAGRTGVHSFDLLYANAAGSSGGAWLLFFSALY